MKRIGTGTGLVARKSASTVSRETGRVTASSATVREVIRRIALIGICRSRLPWSKPGSVGAPRLPGTVRQAFVHRLDVRGPATGEVDAAWGLQASLMALLGLGVLAGIQAGQQVVAVPAAPGPADRPLEAVAAEVALHPAAVAGLRTRA